MPENAQKNGMRLSMMFSKQKGLTTNSANLGKIYVHENKIVSILLADRVRGKKGGRKMKVTSIMLLKTHGGKKPDFRLSIMLMKRHGLNDALHYVIENKDC
jgi:hypothetical protein